LAEPDAHDSGSKDRATVALVAAQLGEVKAIVSGHAELTAERLEAIKERIAPLTGLPERMTAVEGEVADLKRRANNRDEKWKVNLPTLFITGVASATAVISVITQIH
jgi:hypothetical protein